MTDKINLSIHEELEKKLKEKIKETNFKSLSEYILFILEQITSEIKTEEQGYTKEEEADIAGNPAYSEEEEANLKKNLEDLGYI